MVSILHGTANNITLPPLFLQLPVVGKRYRRALMNKRLWEYVAGYVSQSFECYSAVLHENNFENELALKIGMSGFLGVVAGQLRPINNVYRPIRNHVATALGYDDYKSLNKDAQQQIAAIAENFISRVRNVIWHWSNAIINCEWGIIPGSAKQKQYLLLAIVLFRSRDMPQFLRDKQMDWEFNITLSDIIKDSEDAKRNEADASSSNGVTEGKCNEADASTFSGGRRL